MPRLGPGLGRTGACDWTLGQTGAQGTEYCNTCEYGRYVCVVCLGTCLGLLEPFVNKCVYIYFMTTTISCAVLPHFTTQSSRHIPKQRGVTVRSFTPSHALCVIGYPFIWKPLDGRLHSVLFIKFSKSPISFCLRV